MTTRLPALAALLCLAVSGCSATTAGTAMPAPPTPLTSAEALPGLLLSAPAVGVAMSGDDMVVTRDVTKAWNDSARPGRPVGGEAQTVRTLLAYLEQRYGAPRP